jgi:hypothetical protein
MDLTTAIENNIPEHLRNTNIVNFIKSFINILTDIELDIDKLQKAVFISTAKNQQLDDIGALFKLSRLVDETDSNYRQRIKSYYQILLSYGTVNGIKKAIGILLNIDEDIITISEVNAFVKKLMISDMNENWTGTGVSFDNDYKYNGVRGLKLEGDDETITAELSKEINLRHTNKDVDMMSLWCYIDDADKIDLIQLRFEDGDSEESVYQISDFVDGAQTFLISRADFIGDIDWRDITGIYIDVVFNDASECYFDNYLLGVYGNTGKFNVSIEVNEDTEFASIKDLLTVIDDSKAAGVYYNRDDIDFTSEDSIFMINLSDINGDDRLL